MAESSSVRRLQEHLRQAGASLAARQFDAAATHIDAALAIDPASLAALTLRERLETLRAQSQRLAPRAAATEQPPSTAEGRFIPSGVNASSWLDFEQRIQQRRFRALIEAADRAVAAGDGVAARAAVEEARELQPDAGEIVRLSARIALLQVPVNSAQARDRVFRSRTFRAASLLLLGVTLLMGLDWVRSGAARPGKTAENANVPASESPANVASVPEQSARTALPETQGTTGVTPERLPLIYRSVAAAPNSAPVVVAAPLPRERDASASPVETPDDYVALPSARAARGSVPAPSIVRGEVSDDYVAPRRDPVRESAPATAARPASPSIPLASVVRQPTAVVESLGPSVTSAASTPAPLPLAAPPPPAAAAVTAPSTLSEDTRVRAVLNQYASAYGQRNAAAVRSIWPSVDERALAKAFSSLSSLSMSFDDCSINVSGQTARASCRGRASYVGKVGSQEQRNEPRTVRFELKRDAEAWKIQKAETSR